MQYIHYIFYTWIFFFLLLMAYRLSLITKEKQKLKDRLDLDYNIKDLERLRFLRIFQVAVFILWGALVIYFILFLLAQF